MWEGDQRHTSHFTRFPALPRVPAENHVHFGQRHVLPQLPLDRVWPLPTAETVAAFKERETNREQKKQECMIEQSLLSAIDCEDEYESREFEGEEQ